MDTKIWAEPSPRTACTYLLLLEGECTLNCTAVLLQVGVGLGQIDIGLRDRLERPPEHLIIADLRLDGGQGQRACQQRLLSLIADGVAEEAQTETLRALTLICSGPGLTHLWCVLGKEPNQSEQRAALGFWHLLQLEVQHLRDPKRCRQR